MNWKMKIIKKIRLTILALLVSTWSMAQNAEMADTMRADGKIYVVVGIILIILVGLISYLFMMDRKLSRIEKELDKRQ